MFIAASATQYLNTVIWPVEFFFCLIISPFPYLLICFFFFKDTYYVCLQGKGGSQISLQMVWLPWIELRTSGRVDIAANNEATPLPPPPLICLKSYILKSHLKFYFVSFFLYIIYFPSILFNYNMCICSLNIQRCSHCTTVPRRLSFFFLFWRCCLIKLPSLVWNSWI